jgi:hypothetical protein
MDRLIGQAAAEFLGLDLEKSQDQDRDKDTAAARDLHIKKALATGESHHQKIGRVRSREN